MKDKKKYQTVGIDILLWGRVEAQAKRLKTKPRKVINWILADAFTKAQNGMPITDGTVLP